MKKIILILILAISIPLLSLPFSQRDIEATDIILITTSDGVTHKVYWSAVEKFIEDNIDTLTGGLVIGEDDTGYDVIFYGDTSGKKVTWDASADMLDVDGIMKVHNRPVSTDTYALEVKCDYDQASGVGQGGLQTSVRVYPDGDTTTIDARGGYYQCQLHADDTMTGGGMTGLYTQAHSNGGTLDGSGINIRSMHTDIANGGTWTEIDRLSSLQVDSNLDSTITAGTFSLAYIVNNGSTTVDNAIEIEGTITTDIKLQNDESIDNATDGVINFSAGNVQLQTINFATCGGTADAITLDFTPDLAALTAGLKVCFVADSANTGAATLAIDGGTAKNIYEASDVSALEANDIRAGMVVELIYDGTQWQQVSQSGN